MNKTNRWVFISNVTSSMQQPLYDLVLNPVNKTRVELWLKNNQVHEKKLVKGKKFQIVKLYQIVSRVIAAHVPGNKHTAQSFIIL